MQARKHVKYFSTRSMEDMSARNHGKHVNTQTRKHAI